MLNSSLFKSYRVVSCLILSFLISSYSFFYFKEIYPSLDVEIEFIATDAGVFQIYYGEKDFSEKQSIRQHYQANEKVSFGFSIPAYGLRLLRFDPANEFFSMKISRLNVGEVNVSALGKHLLKKNGQFAQFEWDSSQLLLKGKDEARDAHFIIHDIGKAIGVDTSFSKPLIFSFFIGCLAFILMIAYNFMVSKKYNNV